MDIHNQFIDVQHHIGLFYKTFDVFLLFSSFLEGFLFSDPRGILLGTVTIASILTNGLLKQICKFFMGKTGSRPSSAKNCDYFPKVYKCKSYGMPSGHSQTFAFVMTLIGLSLMKRNKEKEDKYLFLKLMFLIVLVFGAMYSRVILHCHTWTQCIVGSLVGFILAYLVNHKIGNPFNSL